MDATSRNEQLLLASDHQEFLHQIGFATCSKDHPDKPGSKQLFFFLITSCFSQLPGHVLISKGPFLLGVNVFHPKQVFIPRHILYDNAPDNQKDLQTSWNEPRLHFKLSSCAGCSRKTFISIFLKLPVWFWICIKRKASRFRKKPRCFLSNHWRVWHPHRFQRAQLGFLKD